NFKPAAPATAAVEIQAAGTRNLGAIDNELVVVKTFILWPRNADPGAVLAFGQGILRATEEVESDVLRLRRDNAGANPPFRVDLRILLAGLIQRRRLEIVDHCLICLGHGRKTSQE